MKTSLSFILGSRDSSEVKDLSLKLNLNFNEFIPHFTLIHFDEEIKGINIDNLRLDVFVQGLYFDLDDDGRFWVGLALKKTKAFEEVFNKFRFIYPGSEQYDNFFPHITLGCLSQEQLQAVNLLSAQELSRLRTFENVPLRYCRNGDFGKVEEVLL
jgi:hypothetical protein